MQHVIVTRYGLGNSNKAWYRSRVPLLKRYLQSLLRQTVKDFSVLLLIDSETPQESISDCEALLPDERFTISRRGLKESFPESIIQTRIDSDDIVACDFVEKVQKNITPGGMLNFEDGYIAVENKFYRIRYTSNMFLSIWDSESCYEREHTLMYKKYPVRNVKGDPMWMHVEHPDSWTWNQHGWKKLPLVQSIAWRMPYRRLALISSRPDGRFS